ncbi:MAG: hypothetical protein HQL55_12295 [Magnetococcales bacterium]|nr:hypothetical protein [Magnetococcales bacterium]
MGGNDYYKRRDHLFLILMIIGFAVLTYQYHPMVLSQLMQRQTNIDHAPSPPQHQVSPTVQLIFRNRDGEVVRVLMGEDRYSEVVRDEVARLEASQTNLIGSIDEKIHRSMEPVFQKMKERIPLFGDWFFEYGTTYKLLMGGVVRYLHLLITLQDSPLDDVAKEMEKVVQRQFQQIVLQPELNGPFFQSALDDVQEHVRLAFRDELISHADRLQELVASNTTHLQPGASSPNLTVNLDWETQSSKVSMAGYEKGGGGALMGPGLMLIGSKVASAAVAPLVTRIPVIAIPISGVASSIIGVGIGLAIDMAINKAFSVMHREQFESDAMRAFEAMQKEEERIASDRVKALVTVMYDDAIQLMVR